MRFEKLLWTVLAIWLVAGGLVWNGNPGNSGEFQAADGASEIPPPTRP